MGGSSPLGAVGYVNAAFELHGQIMKGEMPEPDCIYIASGSMGTAAGLILGIRTLSMKTKMVAVRVNSERFVNVKRLIKLIYQTNSLLSSMDPSFPISIFANLMWKSDKVSLARNMPFPQKQLGSNIFDEPLRQH